jgi:hypothetical protein
MQDNVFAAIALRAWRIILVRLKRRQELMPTVWTITGIGKEHIAAACVVPKGK